jgi:hypothetical protein
VLGNLKAFFVKIKISPRWLKPNIFLKIKNATQKFFPNFFVLEVFIPPPPQGCAGGGVVPVVALFSQKPWLWLWLWSSED